MPEKRTRLAAYAGDWEAVKAELEKKDESANKMAILEAEKILRQALEDKALPGDDVDDIINDNAAVFSNPDKLHYARAMRLKVVDKPGFDLNQDDTREILKGYHQALLDLEGIDYTKLGMLGRINVFFRRNFHDLPLLLKRAALSLGTLSLGLFVLTETESGRAFFGQVISANNYIYYTILPNLFATALIVCAALIVFYVWQNRKR